MKLAAHGLCLILLALPFAARASEDLVAKREACRVEARSRIAPRRKIEVEDYRRIVERRAAYVTQCISRTIVARSSAPLPPKRVFEDAADRDGTRIVASSRAAPRRKAVRAGRERPKVAPTRTAKGKKFRARKVRLTSRRSK